MIECSYAQVMACSHNNCYSISPSLSIVSVTGNKFEATCTNQGASNVSDKTANVVSHSLCNAYHTLMLCMVQHFVRKLCVLHDVLDFLNL